MFKSIGTVEYLNNYTMRLLVDPEISRYYRSFIPKHIRHNIPYHPSHITIVRGKYEQPPNKAKWGIHEGAQIEFSYSNQIYIEEPYIWIRVDSKRLEELRAELGLDTCFDKYKWFHITIANTKGL